MHSWLLDIFRMYLKGVTSTITIGTLVAVLPVLTWEGRVDPETNGCGLTFSE